jgi:hypothetical protein
VSLQPPDQAETAKPRLITENHALGGFPLLERPPESGFRTEDLGRLQILIADLTADFEVPFVNVRR